MKKYIVIILAAMTSMSVFAHTGLRSSTPADNAMLMKSPEKIEVTFGTDVRLVSLSVLNSKDEPVEIDFAPSMEPSETFTYDLPVLMPSNYKVTWTTMGEDGHKMKGDFTFMVHAMDKMDGMKKMHEMKDMKGMKEMKEMKDMEGMHDKKDMKDMKDMKDKKTDHTQHNNH